MPEEQRQKLFNYLHEEQRHTAWEQTAMSEARFSMFLEGLLDIIDPPKQYETHERQEER